MCGVVAKYEITHQNLQFGRIDERIYAFKVLINDLIKLGYEVSETDERLFVNGGELYFRMADGQNTWYPNYYARGRLKPDYKEVVFSLVHTGGMLHSKEQDFSSEQQFCSELGDIQHNCEEHGFVFIVNEIIMPGEGIEIDSNVLNKNFQKRTYER
jgi:hypothetical protein